MNTLTVDGLLTAISHDLRESSVETDSKRVSFLSRAIKKTLNAHNWQCKRAKQVITTENDVQEYDVPDYYDKSFEMYEGGTDDKVAFIDYDVRDSYSTSEYAYWYLLPDLSKIGFIKTPDADGDTFDHWYYKFFVNITASTDSLNIALPDYLEASILAWAKKLIFGSKRQRFDATNMALEWKEEIEDAIYTESARHPKDGPKVYTHPHAYAGFKRKYTKG